MKYKFIIPISLFVFALLMSGTAFGQGFTGLLDRLPGGVMSSTQVFNIISRITCRIIQFGIISIGIMIIVYGYMFLGSRGNSQGMSSAKGALKWGIIGGIVIMGVFTIILSLSSLIGYDAPAGYKEYDILNIVSCS